PAARQDSDRGERRRLAAIALARRREPEAVGARPTEHLRAVRLHREVLSRDPRRAAGAADAGPKPPRRPERATRGVGPISVRWKGPPPPARFDKVTFTGVPAMASLLDILAWRNISPAVQKVETGIPARLPPQFKTLTENVLGDRTTYVTFYGQRGV